MRDHIKDSAGISAERQRLLDQLLRESGIETPEQQVIRRRENPSELPLSFAQQRLWFLDQFEPGHHVYNIPGAFRIQGPLNVHALEASLSEILRRHEVLRTTFHTVDDRPVQV